MTSVLLEQHAVALLFGQELLLVAIAGMLPKRPEPTRTSRAAALGYLMLAGALVLATRLPLALSYRLGHVTFCYGRLGFPGPGRLYALAPIPILWPLVALGREQIRRCFLARPGLWGLALAAVVPAIPGAYLASARFGTFSPSRRGLALLAELGTSLAAVALLQLSGSRWVSAALVSGCLFIQSFGLSDVESPFASIGHYGSSGALAYWFIVGEAWLTALPLVALAVRARGRQESSPTA